jgi:hypothetical protein
MAVADPGFGGATQQTLLVQAPEQICRGFCLQTRRLFDAGKPGDWPAAFSGALLQFPSAQPASAAKNCDSHRAVQPALFNDSNL